MRLTNPAASFKPRRFVGPPWHYASAFVQTGVTQLNPMTRSLAVLHNKTFDAVDRIILILMTELAQGLEDVRRDRLCDGFRILQCAKCRQPSVAFKDGIPDRRPQHRHHDGKRRRVGPVSNDVCCYTASFFPRRLASFAVPSVDQRSGTRFLQGFLRRLSNRLERGSSLSHNMAETTTAQVGPASILSPFLGRRCVSVQLSCIGVSFQRCAHDPHSVSDIPDRKHQAEAPFLFETGMPHEPAPRHGPCQRHPPCPVRWRVSTARASTSCRHCAHLMPRRHRQCRFIRSRAGICHGVRPDGPCLFRGGRLLARAQRTRETCRLLDIAAGGLHHAVRPSG